MTIRVLLADDQALLRGTFRLLIDAQPDLDVVAEASNGREAAQLARSERADVVVMDIRMPEVDGIEAIRLVAAGEALLSPAATKGLITRLLAQPSPGDLVDPQRLATLTPREREVLALVGTGLANDEIAERLFVTPVTVKTHANRAMAKLGARDRAQLVVIAYETGLVRAGERQG